MKIVVWQSAFLGDLVLSSNLLLNLHKNFPNSEITLVARPFARELFKGWDWLRIIPLEKTLKGTLRVVREIRNYDLGFGVQRGLRTSLVLFSAKVKERVGFKNAEFSFLYTKRVEHSWGIHEVERNQKLLKVLDLKIYTSSLKLPVQNPEGVREKFKLPERFFSVSPSANFEPKRWSAEYFAELINGLNEVGLKAVILGAKDRDKRVASEVLKYIKYPSKVLNLSGKTSVGELVSVIKLSEFLISNDSAPVHIAEAVGTPVFAVYCATSSYYGFYPRSGFYFEPKNLKCHPCKPNPKGCKTGTKECRFAVKPKEVLEKIEKLLINGQI